MPTLKNFLLCESEPLSEAVFKHSTHIEDLVFTHGAEGVEYAIEGLSHVIDTVGHNSDTTEVQRKMDGSPAIVFGYLDGRFFVGSKSIFNKKPKINYTPDDVDANHTGELAGVLKDALEFLPRVCPKGKIFQGDFVFSDKTLEREVIGGSDCYTFQPNTIKYAVEVNSDIGKAISKAKFGIVVHTEYKATGPEPQNIVLDNFDVDDSMFNTDKDVWLTDTNHKDVSKIVPFNSDEIAQLKGLFAEVKDLAQDIRWDQFTDLNEYLMSFVNTYIRANTAMPESDVMVNDFIDYLEAQMNKEKDSKKTEASKAKVVAKWEPIISQAEEADTLSVLFDIHKVLNEIKLVIIKKLESIKSLKTFLRKSDGSLEVTGSEGYVLAQTNAKSCKLVDRYQFSKANFSADYLKGWEH